MRHSESDFTTLGSRGDWSEAMPLLVVLVLKRPMMARRLPVVVMALGREREARAEAGMVVAVAINGDRGRWMNDAIDRRAAAAVATRRAAGGAR